MSINRVSTVMDIVLILATVLVVTATTTSQRLTARRIQKKLELRVFQGVDDITNKYPYVVILQPRHFCTGSLITPDWVLTAAHCCKGKPSHIQYGNLSIPLKKTDSKSEVIRRVQHPRYQIEFQPNDIALLLVSPGVRMDKYGAVSAVDYLTLLGLSVEFVGGGNIFITQSYSGRNKKINKIKLNTVRPLKIGQGVVSSCTSNFAGPGFICVSPKCSFRQFTLPGDSGGPLLVDNKIVGVVKGALVQNYYDRYFTPISPHQEWIHNVITSTLN